MYYIMPPLYSYVYVLYVYNYRPNLKASVEWLKNPSSATASVSSTNANLTNHTEKTKALPRHEQFQDHCITATISTLIKIIIAKNHQI